jgi:hypothetical protein
MIDEKEYQKVMDMYEDILKRNEELVKYNNKLKEAILQQANLQSSLCYEAGKDDGYEEGLSDALKLSEGDEI